MSDPLKIALVGATGLIGQAFIRACVGRDDVALTAIARREVPLPDGARMHVRLAETSAWPDVLTDIAPDILVCALGSTWKKSGKDADAFRAIDHDLVVATGRAAHDAGASRMITVSSVGADAASRSFYLRTKGMAEDALGKIGFQRLDILRPGLLRGARSNDPRLGERLAIIASPITDLMLHGKARKFRSVRDAEVAEAALALAMTKAAGRFVHDNDAIHRAAMRLR